MPDSRHVPDDPLVTRVRGEYLEMPGLRLTLDQARRLWNLEAQTCREVLGTLIDDGFLARGTDGRYARSSDDARATGSLRMARVVDTRLPAPVRRSRP